MRNPHRVKERLLPPLQPVHNTRHFRSRSSSSKYQCLRSKRSTSSSTMTEPATASSKVSSWSVASSAMLARSSSLADISRPGSEKMHRSLAVIIQRIIDRRNNSRLIAAKCGASMRPSLFFNKLPPEIRGLIYEFAYESEGGFIKAKLNRSAPPYPRVFKVRQFSFS